MKNETYWKLDRSGFVLEKPFGGCSYKNFLSNGDYGLCLDHLGIGYSVSLSKGLVASTDSGRFYVTHHGFGVMEKGRFLYCRDLDNGVVWNPSFVPCRTNLDKYSCLYTPSLVSYTGQLNGITCSSEHVLPERGRYEVWLITVKNENATIKRISLMTRSDFLLQSSYVVDFPYYSWYMDSRFNDRHSVLEIFSRKPSDRNMFGFCRSLVVPDGFEASLSAFIGTRDERSPESLLSARSSSQPSGGDQPIAAFRWDITLKPGESWSTGVFLGEGAASLEDCQRRFPDISSVLDYSTSARVNHISADVSHSLPAARPVSEREIANLTEDAFASSIADTVRPPSNTGKSDTSEPSGRNPINGALSGDPSADISKAWFHVFLPHQIRQQSFGMIRFAYRGYRDVAQDAMGMCQYDLLAARSLILDLAGMQHEDGRCLRQYNTLGGTHDERDFRDLIFWLVLALVRYICLSGDSAILYEKRPYLEGGEEFSMLHHVASGMKYALRFGAHGLLEMGAGDWNDALSAFGLRGESLWLNQIAYLAINELSNIVKHKDDRAIFGFDFASLADHLYNGVVAGWTGEWFLRGYGDKGHPVGGADRIFLLPQAWFTISGMAFRDPEKGARALDSMILKLDHPDGLLKCYPAFSAYDADVGNLSALSPGVAENFAVYNHASMFGVYALFTAGRTVEARKYLDRVLPFLKDHERTRSEPYILVNYYNGGFYPEKAGRGGISWMTGTANWVSMINKDFLSSSAEQIRCNFPHTLI